MNRTLHGIYAVVIGVVLLFTAHQSAGQQAAQKEDEKNAIAKQQVQPAQDLFKFEENIVQSLEGRIPDGQIEKLGELKGKEFSEAQLSEALKAASFSEEEIKTVLNLIHDHLQFIEAIKKAAPVALAMDKLQAEMQQQEELLKKTEQEEEQQKIAKELAAQSSQLKQLEQKLAGDIAGIDGSRTEQVAETLKASGRDDREAEIIARHILEQVLFAKNLNTLSGMADSIETIAKEIQGTEQKQKNAESEEEKKNLSESLTKLNEQLEKTKNDFSVLTTGIDYSTFLKKEGREIDWEAELKDIFSPIIVELKETTERPRKMERLRSDLVFLEKRIPQARQASEQIDKFLEKAADKKVRAALKEWKEYWNKLEKEFAAQSEADKNQLLQLENEQKSLAASLKVFFDSFVRHRGKSLFFALLAFAGIYLIFRLLQRVIWKISPIHKSPKYMFWANLADVMFYVLTFLVASGGLLAVLFTSGDWLILSIVLLFVFGIIWGAKNTLPHFIEQIKLLLGFGPVRQGERVLINDIPYRVEMMGVYTYLKNPVLTGGTLRLPLRDLVDMRSRPYDEEEDWFPCKEGDYVLIDGLERSAWRKVKRQTPQEIVFEWFGMIEGMATSSFLNKRVFNLSAASFWVDASLFLSYKHRVEVLGIREKLNSFLAEELQKMSYKEHITNHWTTFIGFSDDSSLKFLIGIDAKPEAAAHYVAMLLDLTHIALAAANKYGWEIIRFKPVEVHHPEQAKAFLANFSPADAGLSALS